MSIPRGYLQEQIWARLMQGEAVRYPGDRLPSYRSSFANLIKRARAAGYVVERTPGARGGEWSGTYRVMGDEYVTYTCEVCGVALRLLACFDAEMAQRALHVLGWTRDGTVCKGCSNESHQKLMAEAREGGEQGPAPAWAREELPSRVPRVRQFLAIAAIAQATGLITREQLIAGLLTLKSCAAHTKDLEKSRKIYGYDLDEIQAKILHAAAVEQFVNISLERLLVKDNVLDRLLIRDLDLNKSNHNRYSSNYSRQEKCDLLEKICETCPDVKENLEIRFVSRVGYVIHVGSLGAPDTLSTAGQVMKYIAKHQKR
jgi:hypothetical protein